LSGAADTQGVVAETRAYYDGAANEIYRDIWGENIHLGIFASPDDSFQAAMDRSNRRMSERVGFSPETRVLDVGCGYGALARYLAATYGCRVLATNISDRELEWGRELTATAGLDHLVSFDWADFHELPFDDASFDIYWSQEAFLHAADKHRVLAETFRVLKPGGRLVFSDILVRRDTPEEVRARICERVKSPDMWDAPDYRAALARAGFSIAVEEDWSPNVALSYGWVRNELERRRAEFEQRIGRDVVDRTTAALAFWVEAADAGRIGWLYVIADKPAG
jgi:sarcosine/dimethylglycine N-methyltransferase